MAPLASPPSRSPPPDPARSPRLHLSSPLSKKKASSGGWGSTMATAHKPVEQRRWSRAPPNRPSSPSSRRAHAPPPHLSRHCLPHSIMTGRADAALRPPRLSRRADRARSRVQACVGKRGPGGRQKRALLALGFWPPPSVPQLCHPPTLDLSSLLQTSRPFDGASIRSAAVAHKHPTPPPPSLSALVDATPTHTHTHLVTREEQRGKHPHQGASKVPRNGERSTVEGAWHGGGPSERRSVDRERALDCLDRRLPE